MTTQEAKALIGLCVHEGLKQGVLKGRGEFEELLDYLDKYFIDTDKRASGSSEIPKDLEEAADEYEKKHTYQRYDGGGLTQEYNATLAEAFIAGHNLCKEQMMKEAVEGKIIFLLNGDVAINIGDTDEYKLGEKVCVIVLPKED